MATRSFRPDRRVRPSVSRDGLAPELGIAVGTVVATAVIHWGILLRVDQKPPLILFAVTAVALTFWRGLGPGVLASSVGTAIGSSLFVSSPHQFPELKTAIPLDTLLWFAGSLFSCWLIYKLKSEREDVEVAQDRKNDALAFVSHELRQPLSNIKLAATILEKDASPDTRTRVVGLIRRSATRLARVVDDLADVTLLEASAIRINRTETRLQDVLVAALETVRPAIEHREQLLTVHIPDDAPIVVSGDSLRLQQVFSNVVGNASKYSPEGGEISLTCHVEDSRAVVVVRDTGVGVRAEMLDAIFAPFVREPGHSGDGLGIGLALARNLLTQHGGTIAAHSDGPGQGSTFTIELPVLT